MSFLIKDAVFDPVVCGRIFIRRKMFLQCFQSLNLTFALVGFVVKISIKLRGSEFVSGYTKLISVANWVYVSQLERRDGMKINLSPYIICPVSGQVLYSYHSGHYLQNSSFLRTSEGCLARNT